MLSSTEMITVVNRLQRFYTASPQMRAKVLEHVSDF
jgi:hypothetical protein